MKDPKTSGAPSARLHANLEWTEERWDEAVERAEKAKEYDREIGASKCDPHCCNAVAAAILRAENAARSSGRLDGLRDAVVFLENEAHEYGLSGLRAEADEFERCANALRVIAEDTPKASISSESQK